MFFSVKPFPASAVARVLGALVFSSIFAACSAVPDLEGRSRGETSDVGSESGAGGGQSSSSGSGGSGSGGDDMEFDAGMADSGMEACATTGSDAVAVELDIVILLDRSGSMYGQNWGGATTAIKQFVQDPASNGINVGILYFPIDSPSDGLVCNGAHYQDLAVPIAALPGNASALVSSINGQSPNGGSTPMYGALFGALAHATGHKDQNPNHKVILVFASDGDPNSCPGNQNDLNQIADVAKAALDYNGVETYVIAISGASVMNLDKIAAAGGTTSAYDVTQNVSEFSQKMAEIRATALACEYLIPPPPGSEPLDPEKVAVKHQDSMGVVTEIPHADSQGDCGSQPGWYYDDPQKPKKIELCPASCTLASQDLGGKVSVLFGCKPKLN